MSTMPMPDDELQPKPVYFTPTKSAARVLEELVRQPDSLDNNSKTTLETFSSSNSGQTADSNETPRLKPRSLSHPLPPTPPLSSRTPRPSTVSSKSHASHSPDSTSTSHRPKYTSRSLPRRSTEHTDRHHRRHHSDPSTETPPIDSHHGRHRYAGSHSRFTTDSISSIMAATAERLARETARANEAERHATEVLSLFKTTHEGKIRLEREVQRVKDELGLYKVQLDAAQKEIFRAQEVVDKIERQRADAEEELLRTKDKMRKLAQNLAVEHAMEEGRRLGFEEGLKHGRMFAPEPEPEPLDDIYVKVSSNKREMKSDDDRMSRITTQIYPRDSKSTRPEMSSSRRHSPKHHELGRKLATSRPEEESSEATRSIYPQVSNYNPKPRHDPNARPSSKPQPESTPDVGRYPQPLAIPTITTPMPIRVPSTQPPIPPSIAPHQHHTSPPPESIKVKPSDSPIHPIPVHNSPSVVRESVVLPPDGYIPVLGADSIISLPPPHELSHPVPAEAPRRPPALVEGPPRPKSGGRSEPRARVGNPYSTNYRPSTNTDAQSHTYSTRTGRDTEKTDQEQHAPGGNPYSATHRPSTNPDSQSQAYTTRVARDMEKTQQEQRSPALPVRSPYDRPGSSAPVRPNGGGSSRRAREVVLPVPMGDPFDDPTTANGNLRHPSRSATPINAPYGRPNTLRTDSRSPPEQTSSNTTPPDIQVETPSTHAQSVPSNRTTMVDPILLTPESANRLIALPDHRTDVSSDNHQSALGIYSTGKSDEKIEMTLPDNNFPPGFVPLSPIPGMENLNPYPPGFAPTMPRDHPSGGMANFVYSSPLVRPIAL